MVGGGGEIERVFGASAEDCRGDGDLRLQCRFELLADHADALTAGERAATGDAEETEADHCLAVEEEAERRSGPGAGPLR